MLIHYFETFKASGIEISYWRKNIVLKYPYLYFTKTLTVSMINQLYVYILNGYSVYSLMSCTSIKDIYREINIKTLLAITKT